MKESCGFFMVVIAGCFFFGTSGLIQADPLGTAFTYRGQLEDAGAQANGTYDFEFRLYDALAVGRQVGTTQTKGDIQVNNGMFVIDHLDFGFQFPGQSRWLEIGVRPGTSTGAYTLLSPRVALRPIPYSLYAAAAGTVQSVSWNSLVNIPASFVDGVDNDTLAGLPCSSGQVPKWNGSNWACAADSDTTYAAAAGLTLTGNQFSVNTGTIQARVTGTCGTGQAIRQINANGTVTCESVGGGGGITLPYSGVASTNGEAFQVSTSGVGFTDLLQVWHSATGIKGTSSTQGIGVDGLSSGSAGNAMGVRGRATYTGNGTNYGGYFEALGTTAVGAQGLVNGAQAVGLKGAHTNGNYAELGTSTRGISAKAVTVGGVGITAVNGQSGNYVDLGTPTSAIKAVAFSGLAGEFIGRVKTSILEITGGSDFSENFDIRGLGKISDPSPGMLVSIDPNEPGQLIVSDKAYDRKVAGIISGAGGVKPGMIMGQKGTQASGSSPVALSGRVYCWADASQGAIEPGDLLTTSDIPGHAMKVGDYGRAQGAVIGKAMTRLFGGKGLVLVLVSLQ
jgi:hypothetical protein